MDADLAERVAKIEGERDRYRTLYLEALERCLMLELGLLGQKTERLSRDETQLFLLVLAGLLAASDSSSETPNAESASEPEPDPKPPRRKRAGRAGDRLREAALAQQILADEDLRARVLVLASSSASAEVASESCRQLAKRLGDRHPSFAYSPESLICWLARTSADDLVDGHDPTLFEARSPVPPGSEAQAWACYGLGLTDAGLRVSGRGRRPGLGPGYNRGIGY